MHNLNGKRIALLEARLSSELARLVERYGGVAESFPALREQSIDASCEVTALINNLQADKYAYIIFQTGVGVSSLFNEAVKLGRLDDLRDALKRTTTICRGPKPAAVLTRHGIKPNVNARDPFTTAELLEATAEFELDGQHTVVLHYGERNIDLTDALSGRGARLEELCLYKWQLPHDTRPLKNLIAELQQGAFDAVAFTSQIQARHLFQIARSIGQEEALIESLNRRTVVASIGPTCSMALRALGVEPRIEPEHPKMGPMMMAIARYFDTQ